MSFRYNLKKYITNPEKHPECVMFYDNNVAIIRDGFPKSIMHFLILPRSVKYTYLRPQVAFQQPGFKSLIKPYVAKARKILVKEFNKKYEMKDEKDSVENHILVCCHSVPSMKNLHIHVMTTDLYSPCLKRNNHYNSFTTPFALKWDELPIPSSDPRYCDTQYCLKMVKDDMIFEGTNYGNHFAKVKKLIAKRFHDMVRVKDVDDEKKPIEKDDEHEDEIW